MTYAFQNFTDSWGRSIATSFLPHLLTPQEKDHWEILLRARAIENQCYVLASAQGGKHENQRRTWGNSMLIDPWGMVLSNLPDGPGFISGTLSKVKLNEVRSQLPALKHRQL